MLTLQIGNKHNAQRGITLVEILIIMFILGIMASVVVTTLPDENGHAQEEATRLAARIKAVNNISILTGGLTGLDITNKQYRFSQYRGGVWSPLANKDRTFETQFFHEDVKVTITEVESLANLTGERLSFDFSTSFDTEDDDNLKPSPAYLFYPTGELPLLDIKLEDQVSTWFVKTAIDEESGGLSIRVGLVR